MAVIRHVQLWIQRYVLKRLLLGVALLIPLLSSGCQSTTGAPTTVLTAEDLRFIDTLRELDERSDAIVRTANFGSEHPELKAFADAAGHAHHKRSENIKRWRESSFPAAPIIVAMSVCGESDYRTSPPHATDLQIIDRFIAHRSSRMRAGIRGSNTPNDPIQWSEASRRGSGSYFRQ